MDAPVPSPQAPPSASDNAAASPATPNPSAPVANGEAAAVPGAAKGATVPLTKQRRRQRNKKRTPTNGGSAPTAAAEAQKLTHLVIDSGAIIKGAGMTLASSAENFWTVPEVVAEIRDKKARHHLESLPFELKLREPSDEAMKFAASFARQTGDLRSLSRVDLRVIALTYMLERQETGASHLRTAPVRAGTKVNSKSKGVAAPVLAPSQADEKEEPPAATGVGAAPGGSPSEEKEEGTAAGAPAAGAPAAAAAAAVAAGDNEAERATGEVDSLCAAVKQAWTQGVGAVAADGEEQAEEGEEEEEDGEEESSSDGEEESSSDGEEEAEEAAQREGNGDDDVGDDDVGDDDEWEPDGSDDAEDEKAPAAAPAGAANAPFSADDFPTLGGGSGPVAPPPAPSQAVPAASVAPAATAPVADALAPDASTSSWSLMARSNPAPFKIPAKADPAPLPAAAAPASPPPDDSAGRFSASGGAVSAAAAATNPASRQRPDGAKAGTSRILSTAAAFGVSGGGAEEDDGEGWVNPSNIKSQKAAGIGLNGPSQSQTKGRGGAAAASTVASQCRAGCVTTDFAMQNVILQVGLPLLSLDGMAVRRVKQWILRCAACFKTTTEMGRHFCPVCGNATLDRVSCSVNAKTGATYLHLRKNHKVNLRGSKFSIPAPNPAKGRFEGDLLLREDQLLTGIWAQKTRRKEKDVSSMFGEDITGNVGLTVSRSADIVVGYGRKNPNAARGRERRGKKSVKKRL